MNFIYDTLGSNLFGNFPSQPRKVSDFKISVWLRSVISRDTTFLHQRYRSFFTNNTDNGNVRDIVVYEQLYN